MKKAISLLLAMAMLAFATSAMAADTSNLSGNRNIAVTALATSRSAATMPGFRPGDTVTFKVTGANAGDDITLVTYSVDQDLANGTVQYINQYTADSNGECSVTYGVRSGLPSGKYQIDIKVGSQSVKTVYYKIASISAAMINASNVTGAPSASTGTINGSQTAYTDEQISAYASDAAYVTANGVAPFRYENNGGKWTIGFLGKVTVSSAAVALSEIGANPGFAIKSGNGTTNSYNFGVGGNAAAGNIVAGSAVEIDGAYSFVYSQTIYNISNQSTAQGFKAAALTDAR